MVTKSTLRLTLNFSRFPSVLVTLGVSALITKGILMLALIVFMVPRRRLIW